MAHDWVVAASSNNTLGGFWRPKSGFQRNVWIVSATFPSIVSRMWQTNLWFRFGVLFFFSLSSLISTLCLPNFQSNPSIYFYLRFYSCSFDYYLFYLKQCIKLIFFQFHPPLIFYPSDLVPIILIAICFI